MSDNQKLRSSARDLHELLTDSDSLDDVTRDELKRVSDEIHQVLDEATPTREHAATWREQLARQIEVLESKHPTLTGVLAQLDDVLSGIGI